jgi:hypothetical protein
MPQAVAAADTPPPNAGVCAASSKATRIRHATGPLRWYRLERPCFTCGRGAHPTGAANPQHPPQRKPNASARERSGLAGAGTATPGSCPTRRATLIRPRHGTCAQQCKRDGRNALEAVCG